jgi:MFS family permease
MPSAPDNFDLRRLALPAFGPTLMFGLCEGAILPVLALSARVLGASTAVAGLVVALVGLGSLLANLPAAQLTARFGERRAMIGAAGLALLALLLCMAARSVWLFAAAVFMVGLARSVFMLARQTFLIEVTPLHLRARAMSTLGGVHRVGMFIGPFLGAGAIHVLGLSGAYWVAVLVMLGTGAFSLMIPDLGSGTRTVDGAAVRPVQARALVREHARTFLTLGLACALVAGIRACRQVVIPLWADHIGLDAATTSLVYGIMGAADMLLFWPAGKVMDVHGRLAITLPSMLLMGASLLLVPLTWGFPSLLAASIALGVGNGIGSGIILTTAADASPVVGRTHFIGVWRIITDLGGGGGPVLFSLVTGVFSLAWGIVGVGAAGFLAAWMFWRWLPRRGGRAPGSPGQGPRPA